jgi:hypothetical protein
LTTRGFDSPAAAVLAGFPRGAVRVVAVRTQGDDAYVLVDTRPGGPPYLYGVTCMREADGWVEGSSSNGGGWRMTDADTELGMLVVWDEAPAGSDRVRLVFERDVHEEPIEHGVYLSAWWRVPCPEDAWPHLVACRVGGEWVEMQCSDWPGA